ncbi:hypothetical protein [Vibrio campbellii]|uniref:Integrase n=2 Tax=Vibrio campbellii TaxID=680 RepID=A7MZC5_VIBC1|nr:hypothetical protein [Vibrio campbellii]ABU69555.1 hypothetical protein VIBHAR_00552 [Vibrio campbellii ATCC BAA-1116]AGU96633.1 hypothetical protein M892_10055 [Vibrio campbellii ATCC BAA-1116]MBT0144033.1 hypothetical protein [Vibrio campbellii]MBT0174829.1 hypothetical protein [Vibrio campbellii]MBT0187229.1 hypothetical protein [Vibrio campbellii]
MLVVGSPQALSAPYSQRISNSDTCYYDEKHDKSVRYCPECIAEQHLNYGHGWLKREWLFNFQCSIHNKRLLKLVDTAKKRELSLFKAFESILRDVPSIGHKDLLESSDFESRPCIIAPCLLIDFFRSTAKRGLFDFDELEEPLHRLIQLKRKRVRSTNRFFLLPRVFEDRIKWYAEQRCAGRFRLADPVIMSRTGKPLAVSELNKILREPFSQQGGIPSEGQNLHAIRDVIAALAVASGANIQYLTKASGHSNTSLVRKNVLPV